MKLRELKAKTWEIWLMRQKFTCVVVQPEDFPPEVRSFGDLHRRDTWKRALGNFLALSIARSVLEPVSTSILHRTIGRGRCATKPLRPSFAFSTVWMQFGRGFEGWQHLLTFMLEGLELEIPPNTS